MLPCRGARGGGPARRDPCVGARAVGDRAVYSTDPDKNSYPARYSRRIVDPPGLKFHPADSATTVPRPVVLATLVVAILGAGCRSLVQQNIDPDAPSFIGSEEGLILGSVTAPFVDHYHEVILFHYRSVGDGGKTAGRLTSARSPGWIPGVPACDEEGLPEQCGRLFAVSLPAGDYEIYGVQEQSPGETIYEMPPLRFTVAQGRASYLGNMHTAFCQGLVRSTRGAILGGDLLIRDERERDLALLETRYPQLRGSDIETQLLANLAWRWRVAYEPYDWGSCGSGQSAPRSPG